MGLLATFLGEDAAQDLTEFALLLAFVCCVCAALFTTSSDSFTGIWNSTNARLVAGNQAAKR